MPTIPISFDANDLQANGITTSRIDHLDGPEKNANSYALAHANKSVLPYVNYPNKLVAIKGWIKGSTMADCDAKIDTFKQYLNRENSNLDIGYAGGTRRYIATAGKPDITREEGDLTVVEFNVVFNCTIPFGTSTSPVTANSANANTGANGTFAHTYQGSARYQLPVIRVTLNSVAGATGGYIFVTNNANGQGVLITNTDFAAGDVFTIDNSKRSVTKTRAGVTTEIDFLGSPMELERGAQQINYADSFSSRNYDMLITYNPLWN